MYVEIRENQVEIGDPDNCRALDVRIGPGERDRLDAALRAGGLGRWPGGREAELGVAALRAGAAHGDVGADWPQRWEAMVGYAASKGWLTEDGAYLRAHLVDTD